MKTNIVLIDDRVLFREGIRRILDQVENFKVVAEGNCEADVLKTLSEYRRAVVLIDINLLAQDGTDLIQRLNKMYHELKIIVLSQYVDEDMMIKAFVAGAKGYLVKDVESSHLITAIHDVTLGYAHMHRSITNLAVKALINYHEREKKSFLKIEYIKPLHLLTRRECEILQLLADGLSNRGISEKLFISEKTVKNHVSNVLQKMNVTDRTQAVVTAIKNGWVELS